LTKLLQNVPETQQTGVEISFSALFFEDGAPFHGERRFSFVIIGKIESQGVVYGR
jgi:hypothetical protein